MTTTSELTEPLEVLPTMKTNNDIQSMGHHGGICGLFAASLAGADSDDIKSLQEQIERLDQKVKILERNRELESEAQDEKVIFSRIQVAF